MPYAIQPEDHETYAILTDTTKCTGCEACVQACQNQYNDPGQRDRNWPWKKDIDDLSSTRFTTILHRPGNVFVRQQCRHCKDPACVSACIVAALAKEPDTGAVTYDAGRCMGCRYCMMACPYGIPRYSWEDTIPLVRKCILCHEFVRDGKQPKCTGACPYQATMFGTRAEMIQLANERMAASPGKYFAREGESDPALWGYDEVGGVNVLYISNISLDFLGWRPDLGEKPLPALTWAALAKVPPIVGVVAAAMTGTYWFIGRRMRVQEEAEREAREAAQRNAPESEG